MPTSWNMPDLIYWYKYSLTQNLSYPLDTILTEYPPPILILAHAKR